MAKIVHNPAGDTARQGSLSTGGEGSTAPNEGSAPSGASSSPVPAGTSPTPGADAASNPFAAIYDLSNDEQVKLVGYTIVSVKRNAERILPMAVGTVLVTDDMAGDDFEKQLIMDYLASDFYQSLDETQKLQPGERKYLRVDYVVNRRWPKPPFEYEEEQLETLGKIRRAIKGRSEPGRRRNSSKKR